MLELSSWCIVTVCVLWLFPVHDAVALSVEFHCVCFLFFVV